MPTKLSTLNRRQALTALTGGSLSLITLEACSATGILGKINAVTNAADAILTQLQKDLCPGTPGTACIAIPDAQAIDNFVAGIQAANQQALLIAAGASTLTAAQITQIAEVYALATVVNFPVPALVQTVITAVVDAIQLLLQFLPTVQAAIPAGGITLPTHHGLFEHVLHHSEQLNTNLGAHIRTVAIMGGFVVHVPQKIQDLLKGFGSRAFNNSN